MSGYRSAGTASTMSRYQCSSGRNSRWRARFPSSTAASSAATDERGSAAGPPQSHASAVRPAGPVAQLDRPAGRQLHDRARDGAHDLHHHAADVRQRPAAVQFEHHSLGANVRMRWEYQPEASCSSSTTSSGTRWRGASRAWRTAHSSSRSTGCFGSERIDSREKSRHAAWKTSFRYGQVARSLA